MLVLAFLGFNLGAGEPEAWVHALGGLGLGLIAIFLSIERVQIADQLTGRIGRTYLLSSALVMLFIGTAIGVNSLASSLDERWDLTSERSFSLSPQTIAILESLEEPVEVLAFFQNKSEEERYFRDMSSHMGSYTEMLDVQLIDPIRQPSQARLHEITDMGVILRSGDRMSWVTSPYGESAFRVALLQLLKDEPYQVCFSAGHGEPEIDEDQSPDGFGMLTLALDELYYLAQSVELLGLEDIPDRCSVYVASVMERDWQPSELEALARYLARGGQVLAFPSLPEEELIQDGEAWYEALPKEFNSELARYGIWVGPLPVEEQNPDNLLPSEMGATAFIISPAGFLPHPITESLQGSVLTRSTPPILPLPVEGITLEPLLSATTSSFSLEQDEEGNWIPIEGPITVGAVVTINDPLAIADVEDPKEGGRIVILGSPWVATNSFIQTRNAWNADLVLNSIAWLVDEEVQLASRYRPDAPQPPLLSEQDIAMVRNLVLIFIPGLALMGAMGTWRRRRRL
jgi:hypothetical protein